MSPLPETQAKSPVTTSSSEVKVVTVSAKDNPIILDEVHMTALRFDIKYTFYVVSTLEGKTVLYLKVFNRC